MSIDALREYAALLDRPSGNSQEGWQLVPVELTEEMRKEGFANSAGKIGARALWRAMLAAAPTAAPAEAFGKSREVQANLQDKPLDRLLGVWWRFPDGRWLRDTDARFDGTDTTGAERVVITGSAATPSPQREAMAGARTACHAEEPGLLTAVDKPAIGWVHDVEEKVTTIGRAGKYYVFPPSAQPATQREEDHS